jgi:hypothetical protein
MVRSSLGILALSFCALAVTAVAEDARLINGFNTEADIKLWEWSSTTPELSTEQVTEGDHCVKVTFDGSKNDYPGFSFKNPDLLSGWDKYDVLAVDVFNPGEKAVSIGIRIDDDQTRVGAEDEYTTWYNAGWKALAGKNHFEIELGKMRTPSKRLLNKNALKGFIAFVGYGGRADRKPTVLFLDNFMLKKAAVVKLPEKMLAFDFGLPDSPCWPGFTRVTKDSAYSDAAGFGFSDAGTRTHRDNGGPDDLDRDSVSTPSAAPMVFSVKVAPGKYKVWTVVGDSGSYSFPRKPFTVKAQGAEVFSFKPKSEAYLGSLNYLERDYRRAGPSLWDLYMADRFSDISFEVECKGERLDVSFEPGQATPLCALALWPADSQEAAKVIEQVTTARKAQFNNAYREIKPAKLPDPPAPTAEETERGFILAQRNYLEEITPYFVPAAGDRFDKLAVAAAPGEREPAVFIVYPLRDQAGVSVSVSDLAEGGKSIPAANVKIERLVYRHAVSGNACAVKPGHLVPRASVDVEQGVPRQFWLTVRVPDDAAAGKYTGTVTVAAGGKKAQFPLEVQVYPFKLETPDATYAHVYGAPNDGERIAMDLRCLVEHGFNSVTPNIPESPAERVNGKLKVSFALADLLMEKMKEAGMTGPVPMFNMSIQGDCGHNSYPHINFVRAFKYKLTDQAYLDDLTELTRLILDRAKEKNWLPVIMYPSTEISNDTDLGPEFNRKLIQAIRKAGQVLCVSSVNRPRDVESVKDLDIIMYNAGVPINEKTIKAAHDAGCKLWYQNIGATRYNDGLFLLRTGAVGRRQWVMSWYAADPYSDFDAGAYPDSSCYMFPSPEGTLPTVNLEWMREGVDDYRYFLTLKRLIEKAQKSDKATAVAAEAKAAYDEMLGTCPVEMDLNLPVGDDGYTINKGFKDQGTFDRYRRRAAEYIVKLQKALE